MPRVPPWCCEGSQPIQPSNASIVSARHPAFAQMSDAGGASVPDSATQIAKLQAELAQKQAELQWNEAFVGELASKKGQKGKKMPSMNP